MEFEHKLRYGRWPKDDRKHLISTKLLFGPLSFDFFLIDVHEIMFVF